jgi:hypothetical protein
MDARPKTRRVNRERNAPAPQPLRGAEQIVIPRLLACFGVTDTEARKARHTHSHVVLLRSSERDSSGTRPIAGAVCRSRTWLEPDRSHLRFGHEGVDEHQPGGAGSRAGVEDRLLTTGMRARPPPVTSCFQRRPSAGSARRTEASAALHQGHTEFRSGISRPTTSANRKDDIGY